MITIKEIARLAGTSRGTVDRVLNGRGNVNPGLVEQIQRIAREHHYQYNPFARALAKGGQIYRIGVVINSKGNPFFDDMLEGIHDTVQKYAAYGLEAVIRQIKGYDEAEQLQALDEIVEKGLAALAITPIDSPAVARKLSALSPLPVVTFNNDVHLESKLAFIGCDYDNSGRLCGDIAGLALPQGGKVSIITGSFKMQGHNKRIQGFRSVTERNKNIHIVSLHENNDDNAMSYQVTLQVIQKHAPDLVYFCAAGTEGGVEAVLHSGRNIKIVVVDDIAPMRRYLEQGKILAIVTQQPYRQGSAMVDMLYSKLIAGTNPAQTHYYVENQVKLRSSK